MGQYWKMAIKDASGWKEIKPKGLMKLYESWSWGYALLNTAHRLKGRKFRAVIVGDYFKAEISKEYGYPEYQVKFAEEAYRAVWEKDCKRKAMLGRFYWGKWVPLWFVNHDKREQVSLYPYPQVITALLAIRSEGGGGDWPDEYIDGSWIGDCVEFRRKPVEGYALAPVALPSDVVRMRWYPDDDSSPFPVVETLEDVWKYALQVHKDGEPPFVRVRTGKKAYLKAIFMFLTYFDFTDEYYTEHKGAMWSSVEFALEDALGVRINLDQAKEMEIPSQREKLLARLRVPKHARKDFLKAIEMVEGYREVAESL